VTLQGGGALTLSDNGMSVIFGSDPSATLTNVDNTISGAGQIGNGQLILVNETAGVIDGNAVGHQLIIDTGDHAVVNYGMIEATDGGSLEIASSVVNDGYIEAGAGSTFDILGAVSGDGLAKIDLGGLLEFHSASAATVMFTNAGGTAGELKLDDSKVFTGKIIGFAGDGTAAHSDAIDITDINFANVATDKTGYVDNGNGTGTLSLYDADGHILASITFVGSYELANFSVASDGNGGILIVDPPVQSTSNDGPSGVTAGIPGSADVSDTFTGQQETHHQPQNDLVDRNGDVDHNANIGIALPNDAPPYHHHDAGAGLQLHVAPQDNSGVFSGQSVAQSFTFNFDPTHSPVSSLPNNPGNFDNLELENALKS
ncbi:MAG: hypothetical protein ACRD9W_23355, partial [Terriglobia bacterium]